MTTYDEDYYRDNGQLQDRPALRFYTRLAGRYLGAGPYLDFGCGTGHLLRRLAGLAPADGFEVAAFPAERARRNAAANVYEDMEKLPSDYYCGVTAIHVLEHLPDPVLDDVLDAFMRVTRPGARLLCVMPDPGGRGRQLSGDAWFGYQDPTHVNLKTHQQWHSYLSERGFRIVREGSDGLWNLPYSTSPRIIDAARYSLPMAAQFLLGRIVLPPGSGESSLFVLAR